MLGVTFNTCLSLLQTLTLDTKINICVHFVSIIIYAIQWLILANLNKLIKHNKMQISFLNIKNPLLPFQPLLPQKNPFSLSLLPCFFDWMSDHAASGVFLYLMILWAYTMYLCWGTRHQRSRCSWGLANDVVFCYCSDLISQAHMQTKTYNTEESIGIPIHKNIN